MCSMMHSEFAVPQIEYPLGGSSKQGSHIYFLLIVAMALLLWCQIVLLWHHITMVASEQHLYQTIVQFDKTIVIIQKTCNRKYTWRPFLLLLPSGYYIWGTENYFDTMIYMKLHRVLLWTRENCLNTIHEATLSPVHRQEKTT